LRPTLSDGLPFSVFLGVLGFVDCRFFGFSPKARGVAADLLSDLQSLEENLTSR